MPKRLLGAFHRAEDFLLATLLGVLLLVAVAQIGLRVFFESGLEWAEPVSRIGVLWLALLGALGATRRHKHIAIDALPRLLPPIPHRVVWAISQVGAAVVSGLLAWYGWGMVELEREAPTVFMPGVPSWWPMLVFPFGFALMTVRFLLAALTEPPEVGA
ncbi:TRAP transporter small permease [Lysobacter fragariae]